MIAVSEKLVIDGNASVADLVRQDYRLASIFRKYDIAYCCGGKWPLADICNAQQIDLKQLQLELAEASTGYTLPSRSGARQWSSLFIVDYIINIHHTYLRQSLPEITVLLQQFYEGHQKAYPYLEELLGIFGDMQKNILDCIEREEHMVFPYVRQVVHAYENRESYAALLVRTMRKSINTLLQVDAQKIQDQFQRLRNLTNNYTPPEKACVSHLVNFAKLRELDEDCQFHYFLEEQVLFPRIFAIEQELIMPVPAVMQDRSVT